MILKAQKQTVGDKTVISVLRSYASDRYRLLITVTGVGGDFSQTAFHPMTAVCRRPPQDTISSDIVGVFTVYIV